MFISVFFLPKKKCSFDACWSSVPVAILWPFSFRGAFSVCVSLVPEGEETIAA